MKTLALLILTLTASTATATTVTVPVTADQVAIQAIFDANPTATILFENGSYTSNGSIVLTDASGRNFQGHIVGHNATVTFTNAGSATDSDIAMQRGFVAYPRVNGTGGDSTGLYGVVIDGLRIAGPANGAGFYAANSAAIQFNNGSSESNRYGVVLETSILATVSHSKFTNNVNAGVGLLFLNDTARVWYGATPATSYWNDLTVVDRCRFIGVSGDARLAGILDHGSNSQGLRKITSSIFLTGAGAVGSQMVYGYLGRKAQPLIETNNFFEGIPYAIRLLTTNASLGAEVNIAGVTGAQPSGTYPRTSMPDGASHFASVRGNMFTGAVNDINLQGVSYGTGFIGQNLSSGLTGFHLVLTESAGLIVDSGDTIMAGAYKSVVYPATYRAIAALAPLDSPSFTGSVGVRTTTPLAPLHTAGGSVSPAAERGALLVTGATTSHRLAIGVDNSGTMYSWIQSVENGLVQRPLALNPGGGNVGVGTAQPTAKLQVANGDVSISSPGNGVMLVSPNGAICKRITIDNSGNLAVGACP